MFSIFKELIRLLSNRETTSQLSIRTVIGVTSAVLGFLIVLSILFTPSGQQISYHFITDNGLNNVASAFLLVAAATFVFSVQTIEKRIAGQKTWPWMLLTFGFLFLAVDEVFQVHEIIGKIMEGYSGAGPFRSWNTAMVVLYGFIAVPIGWLVFPYMLRVRAMPELMLTAFLFYTAHTLIDSLVTESSSLTHVVEESFKLFCSGYLALSSYAAFVWAVSKVSRKF